jgi:hypothetical protein
VAASLSLSLSLNFNILFDVEMEIVFFYCNFKFISVICIIIDRKVNVRYEINQTFINENYAL